MTEIPARASEDGHFSVKGTLDTDMAMRGARGALDVLCRSVANIVSVAPHTPSRVSVRFGDVSVEAEWRNASSGQHADDGARGTDERSDVGLLAAPLVGTLYQAPEPGARPYVEIGDAVAAGDQVAIIEAMKLMNPVLAERAGTVREVLVDDGASVEFGQPLFVLDPVEPNGRP